jgi:diguanylate cyclase (GGDEF)-like protein
MRGPGFTARPRAAVPARAVVLSLGALAVAAAAALVFPDAGAEVEVLLWLLALLPAFLWAYYRGWQGAASALAAGMALLALYHAAAVVLGVSRGDWSLLFALTFGYIVVCLATGWLSELLHRAREEAEWLALADPLTGLPNRRLAEVLLAKEFEAALRGRPLTVVVFDLDHFKKYNDTHGHAAGDQALRVFAGALAANTRAMDLSARWGGEEFLSVLSSMGEAGALVFVERVRHALDDSFGLPAPVSFSAGVCHFQRGMESPAELIALADEQLYAAKAQGRNATCVAGGVPEGSQGARV